MSSDRQIMPPPPPIPEDAPPELPIPVIIQHGYHNCAPFDAGALTTSQSDSLLQLLHTERLADRDYLRRHPEVHAIVQLIFARLERIRPHSASEYLDEYFRSPMPELRMDVQQQLDLIQSSRENLAGSAGNSRCESESSESSF